MIKKQPGCPRINKLRVIHLYKADYNLLLKIIWAQRLVWHAHDLNKLNKGQPGSRPGRNLIDVVIQKRDEIPVRKSYKNRAGNHGQ
jgi:hypothetical protein